MDILFVIDYQKDFVDGALGFAGAERLDEKIAARVREYGPGRVWYTMDTHYEDYINTREGRNLPVPHCIRGSEGWQNYGQTAEALAEVGAVGIEKRTFGMDLGDTRRASQAAGACGQHRAVRSGVQHLRGQQCRRAPGALPRRPADGGRPPHRQL